MPEETLTNDPSQRDVAAQPKSVIAAEPITSVRSNIAEATQFLVITNTYPPVFKTVKADRLSVNPGIIVNEVDANPTPTKTDAELDTLKRKSLHASKRLLEDDGLTKIITSDFTALSRVAALCLPSPIRATRLIPNSAIPKAEDILSEHAVERAKLVAAWVETGYTRALAEAEARLKPLGLWNAGDYIPATMIADEFKFEWNYVKLGVSDGLKEISTVLWQREKEKAAEKWRTAGDEIQALLRVSFQDMIDHLSTALTPGEDGKPKRFRKEALAKINSFLETFEARNITNDDELGKLVGKVRDLTSNLTAKDLRTNEVIREGVAKGFEEVKTSIAAMVETIPRRRVTFEE